MPLAPGTTIGRYEIRSLLGQGGMGEVYRAFDTPLGREVALKVLDASVAVDPERVHRFLQEARAASALNHPNIIVIYEAGESGQIRFIASELVEGRTLREILDQGPLPLVQALDIASQVASALAAAHAAGIVHRDIKPENIMVRPDGYVKVLDFGLAKLTDTSASGAQTAPDAAATMLQTTAGVIMGTVAYMSPEQARALKVDARTDCYSLGAVLFEMLTGRQPFTGATGTDVIVAILERDAPLEILRREGLPAQLVWVLAKAIEKNPELRHQSALDLRVDLDRIKRDIATGAVYADQEFSGEHHTAILREVADTDADAIRMYGWSRGTRAAAIAGLAGLLALPFIYRATIGAVQRAGVAEAAAEIRARDIAATLGHPVDGRRAQASLEQSDLDLTAVRNLGGEELRTAVRDGHAARWSVDFPKAVTDDTPGPATIVLTPDGRLRSFTIEPRRKRPQVTITREQAQARARDLARQHFGVDVSGYAVEHAWQTADGTLFDFEWKNPSLVFGHSEIIRAAVDDKTATALSRELTFEPPKRPELWRQLNNARGAVMVIAVALAYGFGILTLLRSGRWSLVGRRLPLALSLCLAVAFLLTTGNDDIVGRLALGAIGLLLAGGALPGLAGLVAWLKQASALRMHGAEQLAAGHLRSPAAASLLAGTAAGAVLAALMAAHDVIGLRIADFKPSVWREISLASPESYMLFGGWLGAAVAIALAIGMLYEVPHRFLKRPLPVVAILAMVGGLLASDVASGGMPLLLSAATSTAVIAVLMIAYARKGFGAVFIAVLIWAWLSDLVAARSVGGPEAGPRATMVLVLVVATVALAAWSYASGRARPVSSASGPRPGTHGSSSRYS